MALFGVGVMVGPVLGPVLGGWLTENYQLALRLLHQPADRHSLPARHDRLSARDGSATQRETRLVRLRHFEPRARRACRSCSTAARARTGSVPARSSSRPIVAASAFYLFLVHTFTAKKPFVRPALFRDRNFTAGMLFVAIVGLTYYASLALQPPYLQDLMNYPVVTAGFVMGPRGVGTMGAMLVVGRLVGTVDTRAPAGLRSRHYGLVVLRDDRLDAGRFADDDHRRRRGPGRRARLSVRAAERRDAVDAVV